jgi:hypothetical protein
VQAVEDNPNPNLASDPVKLGDATTRTTLNYSRKGSVQYMPGYHYRRRIRHSITQSSKEQNGPEVIVQADSIPSCSATTFTTHDIALSTSSVTAATQQSGSHTTHNSKSLLLLRLGRHL